VAGDYESRTGNLTRGGSPDLGLVILQKLNVVSNQLFADKVLSDGLCQLMKKGEEPIGAKEPKNPPR